MWKKTTSLFHQEEGIIVVQAIIDNLFKKALGFRVSSEYGGGHSSLVG
jgi:hypothetical protein